MPALSGYTNVYNTALLFLRQKGFQIWRDDLGMYCAEKDGWDFMAENPCSLLGLIGIFEFKGPTTFAEYWWKMEGDDLYRTPPASPKPYRPVVTQG